MEFDQAFSGPLDWNFPSPTATPTNAHFNQNLHTPKNVPYPTHFQDAFSTPQLQQPYATPQQNQFHNSTSMHRPQTSSEFLSSSFYASMPPPAPMSGYEAAPAVHSTSGPMNAQQGSGHHVYGHAFDPTHMQTPPPTRGTSARKSQQQEPVAFGTPSTIASRRFMTPQQQGHQSGHPDNLTLPQHTPVQFPQLQISPDMYHFGNFGPASAPVVPSSQILWGQAISPGALPPQKPLDDPFAPAMSQNAMTANGFHARQGNPDLALFDTPAMRPFSVQAPLPRPSSAVALSSLTASSRQPVLPSSNLSVDPSLVYSSPQRPVVRSASARKPGLKRNDSANSTTTLASAQPKPGTAQASIRRSSTTSTARAQASLAPSSTTTTPIARSTSVGHPPRTASPLKRVGKTPLGAISENRSSLRRSVVLTIDANGRAVARKVDDSPTKSVRDRYPGLFDSDSSDDEDVSDGSQPTISRNASFSFAKGAERKSKAARLESPVENLQGLSIPRSVSVASTGIVAPSKAAVAAVASLRRHGSVRKGSTSKPQPRRNLTVSTGPTLDTSPFDSGSAHDMDSHSPNSIGTAVDSHVSWPGEELNGLPLSYPAMGSTNNGNPQYNAASTGQGYPAPCRVPIHPAPMSVKRASTVQHHNPLIRCACGDSSNSQVPLVQCMSCTQWLHCICVGLNPQAPPPPNFMCFLCMNQGPPPPSIHLASTRV